MRRRRLDERTFLVRQYEISTMLVARFATLVDEDGIDEDGIDEDDDGDTAQDG